MNPRKFGFRILIGGALLTGFISLFLAAIHPSLPSLNSPVCFYSNQTRQDLKLIFCSAFQQARQSIFIDMYGMTDPDIINVLHRQALNSIPINIRYDQTASSSKLLKKIAHCAQLQVAQTKGLMHRKIVVIDESILFLGSANLTTASLRHHDNLVVGLYHPPLAAFIRNPQAPSFTFSIGDTQATFWLLPDLQHQALNALISSLQRAEQSIQIAMFTFTHPKLTQTLIEAAQRGVHIQMAVDYYTAKGASKKRIEQLQQAGITILLSQGQQLLHHKWALIDGKSLIMGSANWTEAAFKKNEDFLLFFHTLTPPHASSINQLWNHISLESFSVEKN